MADSLSLLDMALQLGERELGALTMGDVDAAESASRERAELVEMAWNRRDTEAPEALHDLRSKLLRLQCLQGRLTEEARRLHDNIRSQLQQSRRETQRLDGYGRGARTTPRVLTLERGSA